MPNINLKIKVDGKEAIAELQLTDDNIKELYKSFKYGKQEVNGFTTSISQGFNNAREIMQGFKEVVGAVQQTFGKSIQLYGVQEKAEKQLQTALGYTSQALLDYATAMQRKTTHGDEEIIKAQSLIASFVKEESQIKALTKASLDLADAKGMSLEAAADLLTKSVSSSTNAMSRYGIEITGVAGSSERLQSAVDSVNKAFGGQAEALAETNIGSLEQFENLIGDVQEKSGKLIVEGIKPIVKELGEFFKNLDKINPQLTGVVTAVGMLGGAVVTLNATGLMPLIFNFGVLKTSLISSRYQMVLMRNSGYATAGGFRAAGIAAKGLFSSLGPITWAIIGITALVEVVNLLGNKTEKATSAMDDSIIGLRAEQKEFKHLTDKLTDTNRSLNNRKQKLIDIQKKYPDYLKNIDLEKTSQEDLATAINEANIKMADSIELKKKAIRADAYREQYLASLKEEIKLEDKISDLKKDKIAYEKKHGSAMLTGAALALETMDRGIAEINKELIEAQTKTQILQSKIDGLNKKENDGLNGKGSSLTEIYTIQDEIDRLKKEEIKLAEDYAKLPLVERVSSQLTYEKEINKVIEQRKKLELNLNRKTETQGYIGGDAIDVLDLEPKKITDGGQKSQEKASDYQELQDMQISMIENRWEREEAINEANRQRDLQAYEGVVGAKEIINKRYDKNKRDLDEARIMAEVQGTVNALNFIGTAVAEHTVAGKAIAVANATWNTYQAATKALAEIPPPFNIVMAGIVTAAGLANVAKIVGITPEPPKQVKTPGYAFGGRLAKGEAGYIEGYHNEIIAPEKDFINIFRNELRPQIYGNSYVNNNGDLISEIKQLNKSILERPLEVNVGKKVASQITKIGNKEIERGKL